MGEQAGLLSLHAGEAYDPCLVSSLQWPPLTARGTLVTGPIHRLVMEDLLLTCLGSTVMDGRRPVAHRLLRATPTVGLCLILLVDGVQHVKAWPIPVMGLLDESAHLITAALVLGSVPRAAVWPWVLIGSVAIDVDHLPLYAGVSGFRVDGGRPPSHSLTVVLLLLAGAAIPALRRPLLGLAGGVILHIVRDMATGPGVPLLWPLIPGNFLLPYPVYVALMILSTVGSTVRSSSWPRRERWPAGRPPRA
jgi:inner membrane protein